MNAELHPSGLTYATVRCLHGNQWLITRSTFTQNNEMADGVDLIRQASSGRYVDFGAGSDWGTAVENLRAKQGARRRHRCAAGRRLTPTSSAAAATHPYSDYVGQWGQHEGLLTVKADHTGRMLQGAGCCNSVSVPLKFTVTSDGKVQATATGKPTYTGAEMKNVTFDGKIIWLHFEPVNGEQMLVTSYPDGSNESVWCSPQQTGECGA